MVIRNSKTDVFSKGVELRIAYSSRSGIQVVALVQFYMDLLITSGVSSEEALFQSFVGRSAVRVVESVLGKDAMAIRLKYYVRRVSETHPGLDPRVENFLHTHWGGEGCPPLGSVAFLVGSVTSLVGRELLKGHGRWRSVAIDLYLQASVETKLTVTASV